MNCLTNTIHINSVMSILFACYLYDRVTEDMGKPSGGDGVLTPMKSLMNITGNIISFGPIRYFQRIIFLCIFVFTISNYIAFYNIQPFSARKSQSLLTQRCSISKWWGQRKLRQKRQRSRLALLKNYLFPVSFRCIFIDKENWRNWSVNSLADWSSSLDG